MSITKRVFMLNAIKMYRLSNVTLMIEFLLSVAIMVALPSVAIAKEQPSSIVETIKAVRESFTGDNNQTTSPQSPATAPNKAEPKIILRLHGASVLGTNYVPKLAEYFLERRGHHAIEKVKVANEVLHLVGQGTPSGEREAIEIISYGSFSAFTESQTFKHVGLEKKFADIGMAARRINAAEITKLKAAGSGDMTSPLNEHVVALDGVGIYVNPSNPLVGLTLDEVRRIYLHEVSDWSEVHGVDADGKPIQGKAGAIKLYCAHCRQGDGTYDFIKQSVFGNIDLDIASTYIKTIDTFVDMQDALASDPNGIGYGSITFWSQSANSSRPLRMSRGSGAFIELTEFSIKTGEYPLTRNLYLYTPEKKSPLVGQFISLALSSIGQTMVVQSHLVSATSTGEQTATQASSIKQQLLDNPKVPEGYKTLIRNSDRTETPYNLRFEAGSGQLDNKSLIDLGRLVQTLKEPRNKNTTVVLIGFSDSRGEVATNLNLSVARAQYVADVLKTQAITQVEVAGFGEEPALLLNPVENSPEVLKDNRRVEVWLKHLAQ